MNTQNRPWGQGRALRLAALFFCLSTILAPAAHAASILGWGEQRIDSAQLLPNPSNPFTAIAAGAYHSLALRSDGTIVGWGRNNYGQATPPAGNKFTAIAAGYWHSLALRSDATIVGWGWNDYGQATPPAGNEFTAIAAGGEHSLALQRVCQYVLAGDLNDDCEVDFDDFAQIAANWLIDCNTAPPVPACIPK